MAKMTLCILVAVLLVPAVRSTQQKTGVDAEADEKTLIANERALTTALVKHDKPAFRALVASQGVWAIKQGFVPMELFVDGIDQIELTEREIVNPRVTWIDERSAVVVYSRTGSGTFGNQPFAPTILSSTVWTKRDGKWIAVHHQETDLAK